MAVRVRARVSAPHPRSRDAGRRGNAVPGHNFQTCTDSTSREPFGSFRPLAGSPELSGCCLHPLRDDVPIVDPCSGLASAGADADLRPLTGRTIPCLLDLSDVKPQQRDPWQQRCQTAPPGGSIAAGAIHKAASRWNTVPRSDAALRATLGGWTSKEKAIPQVTRGPGTSLMQTFVLQTKSSVSCSRDDLVRKFMYTSSTQRAYEDVPWDVKLPAKVQPPDPTIEKMPDSISHRFTLKRYESQPGVWQVAGGMWDRFQTRMFHGHKKPLAFISPYPRMEHIPGYCGFTGSTNPEDIDNPDANFTHFTTMRTVQPQYTDTAHTPNIPGYTGRVHWLAIHPAHSNPQSYLSYSDTTMDRFFTRRRTATAFKHQGPISRMVTTVSPCNPFNKVEKDNF
ncbi:protein SPMIP7 isoform X2 [Phyllobates terribilis]|uniref:protein SPMIP7 isoform X2 n=1 Tax=Phyllobates terribilis TaxID=111132 RepID=UPI003CCAF89F